MYLADLNIKLDPSNNKEFLRLKISVPTQPSLEELMSLSQLHSETYGATTKAFIDETMRQADSTIFWHTHVNSFSSELKYEHWIWMKEPTNLKYLMGKLNENLKLVSKEKSQAKNEIIFGNTEVLKDDSLLFFAPRFCLNASTYKEIREKYNSLIEPFLQQLKGDIKTVQVVIIYKMKSFNDNSKPEIVKELKTTIGKEREFLIVGQVQMDMEGLFEEALQLPDVTNPTLFRALWDANVKISRLIAEIERGEKYNDNEINSKLEEKWNPVRKHVKLSAFNVWKEKKRK